MKRPYEESNYSLVRSPAAAKEEAPVADDKSLGKSSVQKGGKERELVWHEKVCYSLVICLTFLYEVFYFYFFPFVSIFMVDFLF